METRNSAYNNDSVQSSIIFFLAAVWFLWMTWRMVCEYKFVCRTLYNPDSWAGLAGAYLSHTHGTKRLVFSKIPHKTSTTVQEDNIWGTPQSELFHLFTFEDYTQRCQAASFEWSISYSSIFLLKIFLVVVHTKTHFLRPYLHLPSGFSGALNAKFKCWTEKKKTQKTLIFCSLLL